MENGMLGDLAHKDKDIIINAFIIRYDTKEKFDISIPYHSEGYALLVAIPPPFPDWKKLSMPFNTHMWACSLVTVIVGISVITVLMKFCSYVDDYKAEYSVIMVSLIEMNGNFGEKNLLKKCHFYPFVYLKF